MRTFVTDMEAPSRSSSGQQGNILVAGAHGMCGSALVRALEQAGCRNVLTPSRSELDLTDRGAVLAYLSHAPIDTIYLTAAKVGGIQANTSQPADFLHDNVMIAANVIDGAHRAGIDRLLFLGSTCIYPRSAPQPTPEEAMLTGPLDPGNASYGLAKIVGIKLCEAYRQQYGRDYRPLMPGNIYGPRDNFTNEMAHVIPALIRRFHEAVKSGAPEIVIWGDGTQMREFLHVDDVASACLHVMTVDEYVFWPAGPDEPVHVNAGSGIEYSIRDLAILIADIAGYSGILRFDTSRPQGTARKIVDSARIRRMGWSPSISLEEGLRETYRCFAENEADYRGAQKH